MDVHNVLRCLFTVHQSINQSNLKRGRLCQVDDKVNACDLHLLGWLLVVGCWLLVVDVDVASLLVAEKHSMFPPSASTLQRNGKQFSPFGDDSTY
jgi:hypothetical protein